MVNFGSLGNLGNLGNLAQDAVKNLNTDDNKPAEQQSGSGSSNWGEVGSEAKKAFTDFQDKQSKGEKPNYAELGNVAKNAYSAYSKDDGPKDPTSIGKSMVQGFLGGNNKANEDRPQETPKPEESRPEEPPKPQGQSGDDAVGRMSDRNSDENKPSFGENRNSNEDKPSFGESKRDDNESGSSWNKPTLDNDRPTGGDDSSPTLGTSEYGRSNDRDNQDEPSQPRFQGSSSDRRSNENEGYGNTSAGRTDDDSYGSGRRNDDEDQSYGSAGRSGRDGDSYGSSGRNNDSEDTGY